MGEMQETFDIKCLDCENWPSFCISYVAGLWMSWMVMYTRAVLWKWSFQWIVESGDAAAQEEVLVLVFLDCQAQAAKLIFHFAFLYRVTWWEQLLVGRVALFDKLLSRQERGWYTNMTDL
jgi:hypothetical protein